MVGSIKDVIFQKKNSPNCWAHPHNGCMDNRTTSQINCSVLKNNTLKECSFKPCFPVFLYIIHSYYTVIVCANVLHSYVYTSCLFASCIIHNLVNTHTYTHSHDVQDVAQETVNYKVHCLERKRLINFQLPRKYFVVKRLLKATL